MSVSHIPEKVKVRLWGKAGGRCQYEGCNKPLWEDALTKVEFNISYIAHIIADKPDGPRGDGVLSEQLKADISNLMLMCDEHHRLIDKEDASGHTVKRLQEMKASHESRVELLTSIQEEKRSHIILYGANVGTHSAPVSSQKAAAAMVPNRFPADSRGIILGLRNSSYYDHEDDYWALERENLSRQFERMVKPILAEGEAPHFSIFALAPQPLLIQLGRLLSDIPAADVFQLHREPPTWLWQESPDGFEYKIQRPGNSGSDVALNISLSASIDNARIESVLGNDVAIWTLTIDEPHNDFMKGKDQLRVFRETFRKLLGEIKKQHGQDTVLHVFPAMPVSAAVEVGRIWMPKADMPLCIYDQNADRGGFVKALLIGGKAEQ